MQAHRTMIVFLAMSAELSGCQASRTTSATEPVSKLAGDSLLHE